MFFILFLLAQTLPIGSPLNTELEYLESRGLVDLAELRPYNIEEIGLELSNITTAGMELSPYGRHIVEKIKPLVRDDYKRFSLFGFNSCYQNEPENYRVSTRLLFSGQIVEHLRYSNRYYIQYAKVIEDTIPHPWKNFQFFIEDALFQYNYRNIRLEIGRKELLFGPGQTGGLLLSHYPGSYDGVLLKINTGPLYFTTTFFFLGSNRYLSLHRFDLTRGRSALGFAELILYGGRFEAQYLNPLIPYYVSQWSTNRDDNIMWAFDGKFFIGQLKAYGELLIDDYRYDTVPPAPNKLGYLFGLQSFYLEGLIVNAEYVRIDKWVYTQRRPTNTYIKDNKCIGHWIGPDGDLIRLSLNYRTRYGLNFEVIPSLRRKGIGKIEIPFEVEDGSPKPKFPSGTVETSKEILLGLEYLPSLSLRVKVNLSRIWVENEGNIKDRNVNKNVIKILTQVGI